MVYKVIGLMSGSSLDGLDIAFVHLTENGGKWNYEIIVADCYEYEEEWKEKLKTAIHLNALEYQLLDASYGHYLGKKINYFIEKNNLHHQVDLIASHGHTTFHFPEKQMTHQIGNGAAIAANTGLAVVCDLRELDVAFGGEGAPIVPIGEKLLFNEYNYFLNIGGIANISAERSRSMERSPSYAERSRSIEPGQSIAFDVCSANRILNMLAEEKGLPFDEDGKLASQGNVNEDLLQKLNSLEYYKLLYPKSLSNNFGTDTVYPLIKTYDINIEDATRTYVEHVCIQIKNALESALENYKLQTTNHKLFTTGGGAFNSFLIKRLAKILKEINIEIVIPVEEVIKYKEALIMALIGALRWREECNVFASVTGAKQNSIGGALWLGTDF